MEKWTPKIDVIYHIVFSVLAVYLFLGYKGVSYLPLMMSLWLLLLLFDYMMMTIIGVRTQIARLIVWTFRLAQVQSISLMTTIQMSLVIRYVLLMMLLNLLCQCITSLLTQYVDNRLLMRRLGIGLVVGIGLWTDYANILFIAYIVYVLFSTILAIKQRINHRVYTKNKHTGYWVLVAAFSLQLIPLLGLVILAVLSSQLFTQVWLFFMAVASTLLMLIAGFNHKAVVGQASKWLSLIFCTLLYIYIFVLILGLNLSLVLFILYIIVSIMYILILTDVFGKHQVNAIRLIKREESLKQDFSNYLHDDVLQDINVLIKMTTLEPSEKTQAFLREQLSALNDQLRQQMNQYSPQLSKHLTLQENYRLLVRSLEQTYPNQAVSTSFSMNRNLTLPEPYDVLVYRWLRELIHNVYKHAGANQLDIHVAAYDELIIVLVEDDGCFKKGSHLKIGHGLYVIQEQVEAIGGQLYIEANRPRGLRMRVEFSVMGGEIIEDFVN